MPSHVLNELLPPRFDHRLLCASLHLCYYFTSREGLLQSRDFVNKARKRERDCVVFLCLFIALMKSTESIYRKCNHCILYHTWEIKNVLFAAAAFSAEFLWPILLCFRVVDKSCRWLDSNHGSDRSTNRATTTSASIAQWFRLCLPSYSPGFESKHTIYAFPYLA